MAPGVTAQNSGRRSGWSVLVINLAMMGYEYPFYNYTGKTLKYLFQVFWISYDDLLKRYQHFDRTRLFGSEWTITQQWTSLNVPWSADYHSTRFVIELTKTSPVVIVLSQVSEGALLSCWTSRLTLIVGHSLLQGSEWPIHLFSAVPPGKGG